ncbi:MAG: hypothetical protein L6Q81_03930 [Bacteroidia bacterium]|nr:hypothetical protein [Bacteroidia bacterium]
MRFALILLLLTGLFGSAASQSLEFLGLPGVTFGMKPEMLSNRRLIIDSTSSYTDSAAFIRNTRCHLYYKADENLKLNGFVASAIHYEFCSEELGYVFIYVNGKTEISNALAKLKQHFPKMNCGKNVPLGTCSLIDTHNRNIRMILRIDHSTNQMNFVLIPKKAAK